MTTNAAATGPEILLVEDNPGDVRLAREAFRDSPLPIAISVARDGVEALAMLRGQLLEGAEVEAVRPDLILLDLNLPRKDGREVLAEMKADPALRGIPVVVLSSSRAAEDVERSYQLHAASYIAKPTDLDALAEVARTLAAYWFEVAELPPRRPPDSRLA